jgi:Flp pilus assembly pilin Flp
MFQRFRQAYGIRDEHGQTMAEYGLVLALIVLGVISALGLFVGSVRSELTGLATVLGSVT